MFPEMHRWVQEIITNMKLIDYKIGTVIQKEPIKIDFGDNKVITDVGTNIYYTEQVIEKRLVLAHYHEIESPTLKHKHSEEGGYSLAGKYPTGEALQTYLINEGIKKGDKLLILQVSGGQKFIVLSKLWDTDVITVKPLIE